MPLTLGKRFARPETKCHSEPVRTLVWESASFSRQKVRNIANLNAKGNGLPQWLCLSAPCQIKDLEAYLSDIGHWFFNDRL